MVEIPPEYEQVDSGSPPAPVIMRHRLRDHYEFWTTFCHSSTVLSWVRDGFPLKWTDAPPAPISLANHPSAHANADFVDEAILDLVATRTVNEVSAPPHCVLPLGVVPKPGTSKLRLIYDGQYINASLVCPAFKYETLAELPEVLQPNDFLFTIDLKSGYHHLDIHQDSWQYLGFAWKGKYYLFTQLPFGVSVACWAFTKLMRQLFRKWRSTGHRCSHYLDDSLHANQSSARLTAIQQKLILPDLEQAGFLASKPKCDLIPAQSKKYLGMMVNTALGAMLVPNAKKANFLQLLQHVQQARRIPVRTLQRITGLLASMCWAFGPIVRLYTRHLHAAVSLASRPADYIKLPGPAKAELAFWSSCFDRFNGHRPIWSPPHIHTMIHTDASGGNEFTFGGWGAWSRLNGRLVYAMGRWLPTESAAASSTFLELRGLRLALTSFNRDGALEHQTVLVKTDNQAVAGLVSRGGSKSKNADHLHTEVQNLFWYCIDARITLLVEWIPREENKLADQLSKFIDSDDWKVHPRYFAQLNRDWGPFTVDLFASGTNHQLPRYYSLHYTPDTAGINAFAQHWGARSWCNPPFKLIGQVWQHARSCQASMALIFPVWPSASWWHRLLADDPRFFSPFIREARVMPPATDFFLPGSTGNARPRKAAPWKIMAAWVDFSSPLAQRLVRVPL